MRDLFRSNLSGLGIVGSIACSFLILPATARHAYDSSGSSSQPSSSNPYAVNQFTPPGATGSSNAPGSSTTVSPQNQHASPKKQNVFSKVQSILSRTGVLPPQQEYSSQQNSYAAPQNNYAPPQSQYSQPQDHYVPQQGRNPYPQQTKYNGTNFYGISPEQLSGGAAVHENTLPANAGGGLGGYDPRWNPNFGTGAGAQTMARESGGLAQSLRDNFPLPMSGDEAQMFQVNDFAARSNGGMQSRRP